MALYAASSAWRTLKQGDAAGGCGLRLHTAALVGTPWKSQSVLFKQRRAIFNIAAAVFAILCIYLCLLLLLLLAILATFVV